MEGDGRGSRREGEETGETGGGRLKILRVMTWWPH